MSLRLRLLLILAPLFVAGLVAADAGTYVALQSSLLSSVDNQLQVAHVSLEGVVLSQNGELGSAGRRGGGPGGGGNSYLYPTGTFAELLNSSGTVVGTPVLVGGDLIDSSTHPLLPSSLPPNKTFLTVDGIG